MTQLSLFTAGALPPSPADLAGLLAGPGQTVVRDDRARVSVLTGPERVAVLHAELAGLELDPEVVTTDDGRTVVRTAFSPLLLPLALAWQGGGGKRVPAGFALDGPRLRWWCLAAGGPDAFGYRLRLGASHEAVWSPVGAALAAAGLPATFLGPRADGPGYRVTGGRRLVRLRELVGDPPAGLAQQAWPPAPPRR